MPLRERLELRLRARSPGGEECEEVGDIDGAISTGGGHVAEGGRASPVGKQCEEVGDIDVAIGDGGAIGGALAGIDDTVDIQIKRAQGGV